MTLTLELPAAVEEALASEAKRRGTTPEQLVTDDLLQHYVPTEDISSAEDELPQTGAELLAIMEREGLFIQREGEPDSPELARQIREEAQHARNKREAQASARLLKLFRRVWPSVAACDAAQADFEVLHLSHNLGLLDALIGATAREMGVALCTFNVKHYGVIPGLKTEQPYKR